MRSFNHRLATGAALWVAALAASSCLLVVDPEEYRQSPATGGGAAPTSTGPGGSGAGSVVGGAGGAPICDNVDQNESANCGSCGFDCGTEPCVEGVCAGALTLDGGALVSLAVADGLLYLVQRDRDEGGSGEGGAPLAEALDRGAIRTLPLDLDASRLGLGHSVENVVSRLAVGTAGAKHVYFSGQNNGELKLTIQACEPNECVDIHPVLPVSQVQALLPIGEKLYVGLSFSSVASLAIDPESGVPATSSATEVSSCEPPMPPYPESYGLHRIAYTTVPEPAVLMSAIDLTVDATQAGSIYRAPISELPLLGAGDSATRWGGSYTLQGFAVAPNGDVFLEDANNTQLWKIAGMPATATVFDEDPGQQYTADERFLYMSSITTPQVVRVLALDGSGQVAQSPAGPLDEAPIQAIDASHPRYVFYIRGNTIHRWPKPPR